MEFYPTPTSWFRKALAAHAAAEVGPTPSELGEAPIMNCWFVMRSAQNALTLCGVVSGHPIIRDGFTRTSQLVALPPASGWARSVSRWYRLGTSLGDLEAAKEKSSWDLVQISMARYWQASNAHFSKIDDEADFSQSIERFICEARIKLNEKHQKSR